MRFKLGLTLILIVPISALVGCSGSSTSGGGPRRTLTSITVTGASSVFVGSTTQFTATANYSDGSTQNVTGNATWSSSDATTASVVGGLVSGLKGGAVTITAGFGSRSQSANLAVAALLQSITLTPIGPGILVGAARPFNAIGNFNDATTQDLTASATWSSSDTNIATMAGNTATGMAAGAVTITATGTSADGTIVTGTTALDVVTTPYADLNGSYAFTLLSADTRGPQLFAGSFTADDAGGITGAEDANNGRGVLQNVALTGSYILYPDGRGTITFAPNLINPTGITLRFILAAGGDTGRLIQFDGLGTARGTFDRQSVADLEAGSYVFRAGGIDDSNQPMGQVGRFITNGVGQISGGSVDTNAFGVITAMAPLSPSAYSSSVDANGRGTLELTTASGTTNYAFYVVNFAKLNFIQTDAAPATAVAGVAELQEDRPYNVSILDGGFAYLVDRPVVVGSGGNADRREFAQVGGWEFDGAGLIVSGVRDDANNTDQNGQNLNPLTDITGGYAFAPTGGRGTLHAISLSQQSDRSYVFYMVSQDKMFVLQTLKFAGGTLNAPTGVAERQIGWPYNKSTLTGVYALDASDITATYTDALMRLTFDGVGGIGGIADVATNAAVSSAVLSAAYSGFNPNPDASHGRGGIDTNDQVGARNYIFYLASPQKAWILGVSPPEVGSLTKQ